MGGFGERMHRVQHVQMVVAVLIGSRVAIRLAEEGVGDLAPESADMHAVASVLDAPRDLCDVLRTLEFDNGCSQS